MTGTENGMETTAQQIVEGLKPFSLKAAMETIESWIPGLISLGLRLAVTALIIFIGMKIAKMVRKILTKTFQRMELDLGVSRFLLSAADVEFM